METNALDTNKGKRKGRRFSLRTLILISVLSVILGVVLSFAVILSRIDSNTLSVVEAMTLIRNRFVGEHDWDKSTDQTLGHMISDLNDRWSYFLTKEEYQRIQETRENAYTGIGVTVSTEAEEGIRILAVSQDGPAQKAGILPGDVILSVDGELVSQENWVERVEAIHGQEGTTVALGLEREGEALRTVEVTRGKIITDPVSYEMLADKTGYVRIYNFYSGSAEAVQSAVTTLVQEGVGSIVFDLRDNPGGYVTEMTKMLDFLLPEGRIFLSRSYDGREEVYTSDAEQVDLPFSVIVNENSFSAAEFFAAQLRESVEAVIVGGTTSGKGYAQQIFPLQNGSAIGLSTSRYYTGGGMSLIDVGVKPDISAEMSEEEQSRRALGQLSHDEDKQLQAAMNALR